MQSGARVPSRLLIESRPSMVFRQTEDFKSCMYIIPTQESEFIPSRIPRVPRITPLTGTCACVSYPLLMYPPPGVICVDVCTRMY